MNKIKPAFTEKNIPILFASNDVFSPYAAVMIQSVIDHASLENNYDIIIFHGAISDNKQQMIQSLSQHRTNISIRFVNVDPIFDSLDLYTDIQNMRLTKETYYRLAAGQVLSNEYTKIIYLDGDMITLVDIAELYDIELGNCYLAAPYDITGIGYCCKPGNNRVHYRKNVLGLTDINSYFIAGLLVLNLSLLRQDYPGDSLLKIAASREWRQHDQDVLNVICNNKKAILLHPQWNVLPDFGNNRYLPQHLKKMWLESELKPFIIHYGGAKKPWKQNVIREEYFWETAARTPFWGMIISDMLKAAQQYKEEEWPVANEHIDTVQKELLNNSIEPKRNSILGALARLDAKKQPPSNPLISVIIPVYNEEKRLERCLNSVINQTYQNLEIILVDDGSTDNSAAICDKFEAQDKRIRVIHKPNGGVASARNAGLKIATGEYIGWVDSDDWITSDMYEYLIKGVQKYNTPVVICGHIIVNDDGGFRGCTLPNMYNENETLMLSDALRKLANGELRNYLYDRIWERQIFDGIQFSEGSVFEDLQVIYQLFIKARWITQLCKPKYYRTIHEGSIVMTFNIKYRLAAVQKHLERYNALHSNWPLLKSGLLNQIGVAYNDLSKAIARDSAKNYRENEAEIVKCALFLHDNLDDIINAMKTGGWQAKALRYMSTGNRSGWLKGYAILWLKKFKKKLRKKLKKTKWGIKKKYIKATGFAGRVKNKIKRIIIKEEPAPFAKNEEAEKLTKELELCLQNAPENEPAEETKKKFFLSIPKMEGDIALLQRGNLYLFRRLREICQTHNIKYWMIGGTLIGAVRHKGFIPWDDDIDIAILREDMERLMEVIVQYPELKIDRYYHTKGAWQTIKLTLADPDMPFWIDLLLYDYAGSSFIPSEKLWNQIQSARRYTRSALREAGRKMIMEYSDTAVYDGKDTETIDKIYAKGFIRLPAVEKKEFVYRSIDCVCGKWQKLFPCEKMMPFCELEFEGDMYLAPKEYRWYLQLQFGDYYTIPNDIGHIHRRFVSVKLDSNEKRNECIKKLIALEQNNK